jgi:hypothetical protein
LVARPSRREFLAAATAASLPAAAAAPPVFRCDFDEDLRNSGAWGGAVIPFGPTPAEPLLEQREGRGVADFTRDWFQVKGGRLLYDNARIAAMDSFAAALSFNPLRLAGLTTLLMRLNQWRILIASDGMLTVQVYYSRAAFQSFPVAAISLTDTWYQLGISFDRAASGLHFAFGIAGSAPVRTGTFKTLPATMGPETDRTRRLLDLGGNVTGEKLYGYMDNVLVWDAPSGPEQLAEALTSSPPSIARVELPGFDRLLMPLARDPQLALPLRSDVCMSSRWWRPQNARDPNDTMRDLAAFGATRLEWIYDSAPANIRQVTAAGIRFISTINATDTTAGRTLSARDFTGAFAGFSWMATWTQPDGLPPGASCVNNPRFRAQQEAAIRTAVANGAGGIQFDDWESNLSVSYSSGDCLCEFCVEKFRSHLRDQYSRDELQSLGVFDAASFDYKAFLAAGKGVSTQDEYLQFCRRSPQDVLGKVYRRFQMQSVRDLLTALREFLAGQQPGDGSKPTIAVNNSITSLTQQNINFAAAEIPSYLVFEASDESFGGIVFASKASEALQKVSVASPFPYLAGKTRSDIALRYALGQLCLVPYDIWMRTSDLPRAFGTTAEYGDLFRFVRANRDLFDASETVAAVGIAIDTSRPQDARLRPLMERLAEAAVPFVLLPRGRDLFEPSVPETWRQRLPYVIDLSGLADTGALFPNARPLSPSLPVEEMNRLKVLLVEAPGIAATVRGFTARDRQTAVVHLVNRNLDEYGRAVPVEPCAVRLLQSSFWGRIASIDAFSPEGSQRIEMRNAGRDLRVIVPSVQLWTVLRVEVS